MTMRNTNFDNILNEKMSQKTLLYDGNKGGYDSNNAETICDVNEKPSVQFEENVRISSDTMGTDVLIHGKQLCSIENERFLN